MTSENQFAVFMFKRVANSLPKTVAALIRMVHVNRVKLETYDGNEFVVKERHRFSWLVIVPGNLVFRWRSVPVRVLPTKQWKAWERAIVPSNHASDEESSRTLAIAKIEGVPLNQLLSDSSVSGEKKLELVSLAASSLRTFHQIFCSDSEFGGTRLSHGDATVRNVMIDLELETATWFDFDLRHDLSVKPNARHADDLRALLFSAAHYFPDERLTTLVQTIKNAYGQPSVWQCLAGQVSSNWLGFDLFHLAHTRPIPEAGKKVVAGGDSLDRTRTIVKAVCDSQ